MVFKSLISNFFCTPFIWAFEHDCCQNLADYSKWFKNITRSLEWRSTIWANHLGYAGNTCSTAESSKINQRNLVKKRFLSKLENNSSSKNFGQKNFETEMLVKIKFLIKKSKILFKTNIFFKIEILVKNKIFDQKSKFSTRKTNFSQKKIFLFQSRNFVQKPKF